MRKRSHVLLKIKLQVQLLYNVCVTGKQKAKTLPDQIINPRKDETVIQVVNGKYETWPDRLTFSMVI